MPDQHAILSASAASRWMACPPSARKENALPDVDTEYSKEGTYAHSWAETAIRHYIVPIKPSVKRAELEELCKSAYHSAELEEYVGKYVSLVLEHIRTAHRICAEKPTVLVEDRVDLTRWVPEGFGTADCILIYGDTMEVFDLKYGEGVRVYAEGNPQIRLYAAGAYDAYGVVYDIKRIITHIVQPRVNDGEESSETLTTDELVAWADSEVRPRAELAHAGGGELCAGDHCRFCKAAPTCPARGNQALALARENFALADDLTTEQIAQVLAQGDTLCAWIKRVQDHALKAALNGTEFPGFKVVEGVSRRKITDEAAAFKRLQDRNFTFEDVATVKLKGLGELEKVVGKKVLPSILGELLVKPAGAPALVSVTDKRPPYTISNEFKEEE